MSMNIKLPATAIDVNIPDELKNYMRASEPKLPDMEEYDAVRHFKSLLKNSDGISGKYLCSILSDMARLDGFTGVHPYQLGDASQGAGELVFTLKHMLTQIFGMADISMQAGASNALFTALCMVKAKLKADKSSKNIIIMPNDIAEADIEEVKQFGFDVKFALDEVEDIKSIAAAVVNYPNVSIDTIEKLHGNGALVIADVNGMKSVLGKARPGDLGIDIMYANAENLFPIAEANNITDLSIVGVGETVLKFAPIPNVDMDDEEQYYFSYDNKESIGKVNTYYGDFASMIKVIGAILSLGCEGLSI